MSTTVTTTKALDLGRLSQEIGCDLVARTVGDETTVTCLGSVVTEEQLAAAIEAHTPPAPPPTVEELVQQVAALQAQIATLTGS